MSDALNAAQEARMDAGAAENAATWNPTPLETAQAKLQSRRNMARNAARALDQARRILRARPDEVTAEAVVKAEQAFADAEELERVAADVVTTLQGASLRRAA